MTSEQKAEKARLQMMYGELMAQTFRNLIAVHRWSKVAQRRQLDEDEESNKRFLQEAVAKVLQASDPGNKLKIKAMSGWLAKADLSSNEMVIAQQFESEQKANGSIRSPITYG
jgi:hypothetical protein